MRSKAHSDGAAEQQLQLLLPLSLRKKQPVLWEMKQILFTHPERAVNHLKTKVEMHSLLPE